MRTICLKVLAPVALASALGFPCVAMFAAPLPVEQASSAGNSKADVKLAAKIRKAVVDDKSLSMSAHNVDIVVKDGTVTIKGQVPSLEQKEAILEKARDIAGASSVTDAMTVAPPK